MMIGRIAMDEDALRRFCRRWRIRELALFGSALRDDFGLDSDVDVLVTYAPDAHWTLFDEARMQTELEAIFGRAVDLLSRRAVEESSNWLRREAILSGAESVYVETQ